MAKKNMTQETKEKMSKVFNQAKVSLRVLETLEKETLAKARGFVKLPSAEDRKRLTNERILASLKKMGVATQEEVETLRAEVQSLRAEVATLRGNGASTQA